MSIKPAWLTSCTSGTPPKLTPENSSFSKTIISPFLSVTNILPSGSHAIPQGFSNSANKVSTLKVNFSDSTAKGSGSGTSSLFVFSLQEPVANKIKPAKTSVNAFNFFIEVNVDLSKINDNVLK